jgi:hypothetical protein
MGKTETKIGIACKWCATARVFVAKLSPFLLVCVGFLTVVGFAMQTLVTQTPPLIVAVLFLLFVILVLLITLLWCACGNAGRLQSVLLQLPMLQTVATSLNATAEALFLMEQALRDAQVPVRSVGSALHGAGDNLDEIAIPKITPHVTHFNILNADVVTGLSTTEWKPFGDAKTKLQAAGEMLNGDPDSLEAKLGETADQCHTAAVNLKVIAQEFGQN